MKRLKQEHIGALIYIPMLGKQIEATEENAAVLIGYGHHNLFQEDAPQKPKRKTKVKHVAPAKDDDPRK